MLANFALHKDVGARRGPGNDASAAECQLERRHG